MILPLLLSLQSAAVDPSASTQDKRDIIVLGVSLKDSERNWEACRKRHCPPDKEIEAALAHGENLFVAGDYRKARGVLAATIRNTRGAAALYPVAVGDLRRAEARVAAHMGETDDVRRGMVASREALKAGLGSDDPRTLAQRLQIGDSMMIEGPRPVSTGPNLFYEDARLDALKAYASVARDAHRLGLVELEGRALLRSASLLSVLAARWPDTYDKRAQAAIARITDTTDARMAIFREAATMLAARIDASRGDAGAIDRLVATYRGPRSATPVLLYTPPIDWNGSRDRRASASLATVAQNRAQQADLSRSDEWADVEFRINADGRVEDVDVVRESANRRSDWIEPVLAQIRGRRYAPLLLEAGTTGQSRIERHTYTASWSSTTGSGIRQQVGQPRVVILDLTVDPAARRARMPLGTDDPAAGAPRSQNEPG